MKQDNTMQGAILRKAENIHKAEEDAVFSLQLLRDKSIRLNQVQEEYNIQAKGRQKCMMFNRPGVARAVLQTPWSLIQSVSQSVSDPFPPNLQNIITSKP